MIKVRESLLLRPSGEPFELSKVKRTLCTIQAGNASEAGAKGSVSNMSASISCGAKTIDINILSVDTEDKKSKIATLNVTLGK